MDGPRREPDATEWRVASEADDWWAETAAALEAAARAAGSGRLLLELPPAGLPERSPAALAAARALLELPVPCVAVARGPLRGAALLLALACDYRALGPAASVEGDPDADLRLALLPPLFVERAGAALARRVLVSGETLSADACVAERLADVCAPEARLLQAARERVAPAVGKHRETFGAMKRAMAAELMARFPAGSSAI